jgi:hypothetical protein
LITEFKEYISDWILNDLSTPITLLNNLSKCPYAKTAYLEDKVKFYDASETLFNVIDDIIETWDNNTTEVAIINLGNISKENIETTVNMLNDWYIPLDFIFLDDHVENVERINDVVFNNGKYNVLFLQKKSKLDLATEKLKKLGYYKNWTEDYYNEVVSWRLNRT